MPPSSKMWRHIVLPLSIRPSGPSCLSRPSVRPSATPLNWACEQDYSKTNSPTVIKLAGMVHLKKFLDEFDDGPFGTNGSNRLWHWNFWRRPIQAGTEACEQDYSKINSPRIIKLTAGFLGHPPHVQHPPRQLPPGHLPPGHPLPRNFPRVGVVLGGVALGWICPRWGMS